MGRQENISTQKAFGAAINSGKLYHLTELRRPT